MQLLFINVLVLLATLSVCTGTLLVRISESSVHCDKFACLATAAQTDSETVLWTCCSLQAGLDIIKTVNCSRNTSTTAVTVLVPSGEHVIESPTHLGSASVELVGVESTAGSPVSIQCTYNIDVDQEQIFNLSYVYTDYTLYFNRSKSVSISNINMRGCQFPLRLDTIGRVEISNSSFTFFSEAVLDIFNSADILIKHCVFFNNSGTGISRISFRANTGAVAIGFNNIQLDQPGQRPLILVSNCNFTRNRATAESFFRSTDTAFNSRIFSGRGGGLGLFVNDFQYNISAMIHDNLFAHNFARSYGGGLFMVIFGRNTQNMFLVERNVFESNRGVLGAGGVLMTFFSDGVLGYPHTTKIADCSFSRNSGISGGGLLVGLTGPVQSLVLLERCNFTQNSGRGFRTDLGSAFTVWLVGDLQQRESLPKYHMTDCIFEDNSGTNGVISLGYAPFAFYGRNLFTQNKGTSSLRIVGSLVELYGTLEFLDNDVGDTAALELVSSSQLRLHQGARMEFKKNRGRFGASILVAYGISLRSLSALANNPQCFLLYENGSSPILDWTKISIVFRDNEAVLGSSLYASTLRECSWFSLQYPFFKPQPVLNWPFMDFGNDSKNTGYEDIYSTKYHIGTDAVEIDTFNTSIGAWPGYNFKLPLVCWDEFSNPTSALVRFAFSNENDMPPVVVPQVVIVDGGMANTTLVSEFSLQYSLTETKVLTSNSSLGRVTANVPFESSEVTPDMFEFHSALCPGGYGIAGLPGSTALQCQCLEQSMEKVIHCEEDQDSIIIEGGFWVVTTPSTEAQAYLMHFYTCPAGYCRCVQNSSLNMQNCVYLYVNSNPDAQCRCNRKGILCGMCKDQGVSVLFDKCTTCSSSHSILIPILIAIQVASFVVVVLADRKFISLVYPFTFYIQLIPFTGAYFHDTFITAGQYLHYLSSALSFYFPYDFCIYSNMDPVVSYILRFLPFLVSVSIISFTLAIRRVKWKRKLKHHGVWTIVLLIYTHTVHTCMSVLNCPSITDKTGTVLPRWFPDGETVCFNGRHLPVALLALLVLLLCVLLIPLVLAVAQGKLSSLKGWEWTKNFQESLTVGFKEKYKWWTGLELTRRLLFVCLVILFPRNKVAVLLLMCIMLSVYGFYLPYKDPLVNVMEILVELDSFFLLLLVSSGILEPYYTLPPENANSASCAATSKVAAATWILLPFYYFPLLPLVVALVIASWKPIRTKLLRKRETDLSRTDQSNEYRITTHFTSNYLSYGDSSEIELPTANPGQSNKVERQQDLQQDSIL